MSIRQTKRTKPATYIVASISGTVYTGTTGNLWGRMLAYKAGKGSTFATRYGCNRLVYFAEFDDMRTAIAWEKTVKGWSRAKKIALIERDNPQWLDLSRSWFEHVRERPLKPLVRKQLEETKPRFRIGVPKPKR